MERFEIEDSIRFIKDYLSLMWCIYSNYEENTSEDLNLLRIGIQTFLELAQKEVDKLLEKIETK